MIHVTKSHQQQNMSEYTVYNTGQMKLLNKWDQCFDFHCDWVYGSRLNRTCQATWQVVDTWPTLLAPFVSVFLTYPPFPFIPSTAHPYPHSLILSSLLPFQSGVYFATSHCWYCLGTWSSSGRNTPETKPRLWVCLCWAFSTFSHTSLTYYIPLPHTLPTTTTPIQVSLVWMITSAGWIQVI